MYWEISSVNRTEALLIASIVRQGRYLITKAMYYDVKIEAWSFGYYENNK